MLDARIEQAPATPPALVESCDKRAEGVPGVDTKRDTAVDTKLDNPPRQKQWTQRPLSNRLGASVL